MFFSSIKEINTLVSKGMPNIYLEKLTFLKFRLSKFQTFWYNLKIRGLGAKVCVAFLLF